jgi:two-component system, NarL family, sensor histidine kinase BarA
MTTPQRTPRLLLVDDNPDNLEMLTVVLGQKYNVAACGSPAEAFRVLQASHVDVLVLDIGMAPMDGVQCLGAIRAMPGYESTPAIALTAFARDVERQDFLAAGFQAVVTKPILDQQRFERLIDSFLESVGAAPPHDPSPRRDRRPRPASVA